MNIVAVMQRVFFFYSILLQMGFSNGDFSSEGTEPSMAAAVLSMQECRPALTNELSILADLFCRLIIGFIFVCKVNQGEHLSWVHKFSGATRVETHPGSPLPLPDDG